MRTNPFIIADAPAWLSGSEALEGSEDPAKRLRPMGMIPHVLERLLEVAESVPRLYDALPWLRDMNLWALIIERYSEALFPDTPPSPQEATLLSFFAEVTQPAAEMIEALYLTPFLRERHTVWEVLRRMAHSAHLAHSARPASSGAKANTKALPEDVVTGVCASVLRERAALLRKGIQPRPATWKVTWRPIPVRIRWPQLSGCLGCPGCLRCRQGPSDLAGVNPTKPPKNSFVVLVIEETTGERGRAPRGGRVGGEEESQDKVLAFRCAPDIFSVTATPDSLYPKEANEALETVMKLALYDALVFPLLAKGQFVWPPWNISPPTHLYVQAPMPKAIWQAAGLWRVKAKEIMQPGLQPDRQSGSRRKKDWECKWETKWGWEWERALAGRVLDPVQYLRILDRVCERTCGNAPFLARQQVVRHLGWHMLPRDDPLVHCPGLGGLLPSYPAVVGEDGSVVWHGWHYRDYDEDVLRYFPKARVTIRPSPLAEAAVLVYWRGSVLCYAVAEELCHEDGSYRPYWFPYPRLGE